jgi:pimeloyl-ACP methyl ester carboxylesterase
VHHWVDQGYAVVRVEKPGAGEYINCADCMEMTFTDELEGFSNGYEKIQSLDYVDKDNIILYGHSLGGNVAPYLAAKYFPKGVITYGTVIRPWEEFLIAMMRYQQPVIGEDYVQNEEGLAFARKAVYQLFHEKKTLADLQFTNQEKHLLQDYLGVTEDGLVFNRTLAFWQALNDHNFTAYWSKVESKVLSLYGSADIEAVSPRDAQTIAEVVNHYHPNHATFKLIEGADHAIIQVGDQKTGWDLKQTGQYQQYLYGGVDKGFLQVVDEWLAKLGGEPTLHPKTKVEQSFSNASTHLPAYMTHFGTMDVESADLDQDGDEDIVLAMEGQSNLILWNNGKGDFSNAQKLPSKHPLDHPKLTGEDSEDIAIADFDQDGD